MSRSARVGQALLAVALACGVCSKGSSQKDGGANPGDRANDAVTPAKLGFSRCIQDWPTAGGPHPVKPSLQVDAPTILWDKQNLDGFQLGGGYDDGGPVLSKNRLAFQSGDYVYFLEKDGTAPQRLKFNTMGDFPSALVADLEGNIYYVAAEGVYSVDASGNLRWSQPYGKGSIGEFSYFKPPVLSPDGVVYVVTSDQNLVAMRASDGGCLWSRPAPWDQMRDSRVIGGGGNAVFASLGSTETDALDTADGSMLGSFVDPADGKSFVWGWGAWVEGWDFGIGYGNMVVFDTCGTLRWYGTPKGSGVIVPGELLAIATDTQVGSLLLFNANGAIVAGPAPAEGWPIAAGADGTIYTFRCEDSATVSTNRILAYSLDLKELWRIDLGGASCLGMTGNVVLDGDGVMYLMRGGVGGFTEIIAIQTRSPGLADSSWPSWRHDNRGTAWLVPGTPATTIDDAAVSDVADAPVDGSSSD